MSKCRIWQLNVVNNAACAALRPFPGQTRHYRTMIVLVGVMGKHRVGFEIIDPIVVAAAGTLMAEGALCSPNPGKLSAPETSQPKGFSCWKSAEIGKAEKLREF